MLKLTARKSFVLAVLALCSVSQAMGPGGGSKAPFMTYMLDAAMDDQPQQGPLAPFGSEDRPAPKFMRDDIPLVYNTPSPSQVKPELIGPVQFIRTARIHEDEGTVTFPLYQGHNASGETAWYILTDTTSRDIADHLGLAFTAKMGYAAQGKAVRPAKIAKDGTFIFSKGKVDFSPVREIKAGTSPVFPPKVAQPGSVGDADYTPIVKINEVFYNAPVLAFNVSATELQKYENGNVDYRKVHDKVVRINPREHTVTLKMTAGYSFAKPIFYLSTESNDPIAATLEESTLAPALKDATQDIPDAHTGQGNERIAIFVNGPRGLANPFRQGLESALLDGKFPLNVFGGVPTINLDYSPLWDAELVQWSATSVSMNYRTRIIDLFQMFGLEKKGVLEGFGGGPIKRSGIIINCPVLARLI